MSLVYAGICCHAPGITNRPETVDPSDLAELKKRFEILRREVEAADPAALVVRRAFLLDEAQVGLGGPDQGPPGLAPTAEHHQLGVPLAGHDEQRPEPGHEKEPLRDGQTGSDTSGRV